MQTLSGRFSLSHFDAILGGPTSSPPVMADVRNIVTTVSLAIAVIAGGWAYYVLASVRLE